MERSHPASIMGPAGCPSPERSPARAEDQGVKAHEHVSGLWLHTGAPVASHPVDQGQALFGQKGQQTTSLG